MKIPPKEAIEKRLLDKGWIPTKERWVHPNEIKAGLVIRDGWPLVPIETIENEKGRKYRVISQKYINYLGYKKDQPPEPEEKGLPDF